MTDINLYGIQLSQRTTKPTISFVRPAKTQVSLRNRAVWSVFTDRMYLLKPPDCQKRDKRELLPYWVNVQAEMSLCWSHRSYCRFRFALAQLYLTMYAVNTLTVKHQHLISNSILCTFNRLSRFWITVIDINRWSCVRTTSHSKGLLHASKSIFTNIIAITLLSYIFKYFASFSAVSSLRTGIFII